MKRPIGYYLTHWYTYRSVVGVVLAVGMTLGLFFIYSEPQIAPVHPEDRLYDTSGKLDPNVVVVGIDDPTIQNVGRFPFGRDRYATLLDQLKQAGAAVVAFDIQFSEPTGANDDLFAEAIARDKLPVVFAYGQTDLKFGSNDVIMTNPGDTNRPLDKLVCGDPAAKPGCKPVAQLGSTAVIQDFDGVVRRMPMYVDSTCATRGASGACGRGILNPLSFAAYAQFTAGNSNVPLVQTGSGALFGEAWTRPLWTDGSGQAMVNYFGKPGMYQAGGQYVSFGSVLTGSFDKSLVKDRIALVGLYKPTGIHDEQQVPTGLGAQMAGVEIQANMIETLDSPQQKGFLQPEPPVAVFLTLLLLGLLLGLLLPRLPAVWGAAATLGVIVAYTLFWVPLFTVLQTVPNYFEVWLATGGMYAGLMAYRFLYEEREKQKVKGIFGKYLKPELVDILSAQRSVEDVQSLMGGDRRELSLLFVDIRGFTHMSESMDAKDVLRVLDTYLDELTHIVFKWDGTLDKYVGDEIMAIWNAPHEQSDHAVLALRCAWEMVQRMPEIQAKLSDLGLPSIQYGIGVNTGSATVGFMGTGGRNTYTAIGDTVNTAARFCGAAGPTQILIGELTYQLCKDIVAVDMVPGLQLKGKSAEKFTVYRVTAIREAPGQPWATVPGLETYSEVGVYHQATMIGAGATVSLDVNEAAATGMREVAAAGGASSSPTES